MKRLIALFGSADNCVLVSQAEDSQVNVINTSVNLFKNQQQQQFVLVLCNSIGTPLESKYVDVYPQFWSMNSSYIVVASKSYVYFWNYQSTVDRNSLKKQTYERIIFIDSPNTSVQAKVDDPSIISIGSSVQV